MTDRYAILALLEAKPGKEAEVATFLKEVGTSAWFALQIGQTSFGIFDTFASEDGRTAHLAGEIAKALFAKADDLFSAPPQIMMADILASK